MSLLVISFGTFIITLTGGFIALACKDRLHLILGFSAGAVIGVTFFDLLPESLNLTASTFSTSTTLAVTAGGFALYLIFDRFILQHSHLHTHDGGHEHHGDTPERGIAGAASLALHSFLDGMGIGLAFHVSTTVGLIVAAAVLAHDFSDGINTVSLVVRHQGKRITAIRWLFVDAIAPVLGVLATFFFTLADTTLGLLLALFAGFFLYIGATDLIPESHHQHPVFLTTLMTLLGMATIYVVITLAVL